MSVPFSTKDADVISRESNVASVTKCTAAELVDVYELDRCVDWIETNALKRVALQFPDELLVDSTSVAEYLQKQTSSLAFILADTSYGSCCVDEVAAEHYHADSIIHFGQSCLSPTQRLPVLYVFGRQPLDVSHCCTVAAEVIQGPIILIYDVRFHHYGDKLEAAFSKHFPSVVTASLAIPGGSIQQSEGSQSDTDSTSHTVINQLGRKIVLAPGTSLSDYSVCYIGEEGMAMTNWILHMSSDKFFSYSPCKKTLRKDNMNVNRFLMKRFNYIERAKDAQIVGLLVGTLGVSDYIDVLDRMRKLAKDAGKKTYTFVVGKINVPKLANFLEIDIYVLVACPENSLLDSSEFYRPVITPYELEMACNQARDWTGKLVTDFRRLLPGGADYVAEPDNPTFEGDVSLVTGRVRYMGVHEEEKVTGQGQLATQQTSLVAGPTAGAALAERSWQGLETKLGQTPVQKATEGRRGIAISYADETDLQ